LTVADATAILGPGEILAMTMRCLSILVCAAVLMGCGDDEPADEGDSGSSSTGADDDSTATLTSTTVSTSATTSMTTTDATTDVTTESSGTTEPGDSSSEGTETGADSSGTDTGGNVDAYGPCDLENDPQCPMDQECIDVPQTMIMWCAAACESADECPTPATGDAEVVCAGPNGNQCALDCSGGATCPDDMECVVIVQNIERCVWTY